MALMLAVAVAGGAGFGLGRFSARSPAESGVRSASGRLATAQPTPKAGEGDARATGAGAAESPEAKFRRLAARIHNPVTEREAASALAELAAHDPQRALALALAEPNLRRRVALRDAVLRGWAAHDPDAAAQSALAVREADRTTAVAAVLAGAVEHSPDGAVSLGVRLIASDSAHAADYGQALLTALAEAGEFGLATKFVAASPATPLRAEQMNAAFQTWAEHEPQAAAEAVNAIADPALREEAFRGMAVGWAAADPVGLANFAAGLPAGEGRAQALANALPRWVEQDPVAAASWLAQHDTSPDFDMGVIAVANQPGLLTDRPEMAMNLASSIADPPLRTNTLRTLALKWAEHDPASARHFVETSADFSPEERVSILAETGQKP
jgi:hypothetical protein